jgi:hypothetical protein
MPTVSCSADVNPLLVVAFGANLSEVRAEGVFDHVVRDLRESAIVVSACTRDQ